MNTISANSKENIINIKKGPQFKSKGGGLFAFVSIALFVISLAAITTMYYYFSAISFVFCFILIYYFIDIRGIQLDKNTKRIREYKLFLWIKIGKWQDLNNFKSIYLTKKRLVTSDTEYFETHYYYYIKLVDESNKKEIILSEFNNYNKAFKIAKNVAVATGLTFKNITNL